MDKYKLHVEEVDKITSLLLGLSSRLARSEISLINLKKNWSEDEEVSEEGLTSIMLIAKSLAFSLHQLMSL